MSDKPTDKWMTPSDNGERRHFGRRRSVRERRRERLLADWYGETQAEREIEALQAEAEPVAEILDDVLAQLQMTPQVTLRKLIDAWPKLIGPAFARETAPIRIERNILFVEVYSAALRYQLETGARRELETRIREHTHEIQTVRFVAGGRSRRR